MNADNLAYRIKVLPEQLAAARRKYARLRAAKSRLPMQIQAVNRKLKALQAEARRYGMKELLTNPNAVNRAWEREVEMARCEAMISQVEE